MASQTDDRGGSKSTVGARPTTKVGTPATQSKATQRSTPRQGGAPKVQAKPVPRRPAQQPTPQNSPYARPQQVTEQDWQRARDEAEAQKYQQYMQQTPVTAPFDWMKQQIQKIPQAMSEWGWRNNPQRVNPTANPGKMNVDPWAKALTVYSPVRAFQDLNDFAWRNNPQRVSPSPMNMNKMTTDPFIDKLLGKPTAEQKANDAWAARYTGQAAAYYKEQERQARANKAYSDRMTGQAAEYYSRPVATLPEDTGGSGGGYGYDDGGYGGGYGGGGYGRGYGGSGYNSWEPGDPVNAFYNQMVQWNVGTPKGG